MLKMAADMKLSLFRTSSNPLPPSSSLGDYGHQDSPGEKAEVLSPAPATPTSKDSGKKKRLNRAAKLRQCKLDARRGQFLAQVAGKLNKPESCSSGQDNSAAEEPKITPTTGNGSVEDGGSSLIGSNGSLNEHELKSNQCWATVNAASKANKTGQENDALSELRSSNVQRDLEVQQSPTSEGLKQVPSKSHKSPGTSNVGYEEPRGGAEGNAREEPSIARIQADGFSTWSSSEASTSRSNSSRASSRSDESGSDEDDSEVDDWETAADALHVQAPLQEAGLNKTGNRSPVKLENPQSNASGMGSSELENFVLKPESKYRSGTFGARMRADVGRAWRPDDVSRPPTLPRLSKQHSFPIQSGTSVWGALHGNIWGQPPAPSHCPICTEELDTTDSSFIPCSCGFRLCLFCHHKIVLGDGRCPGCRKSYSAEVALKLSRTCTVRPRS